jgi:hypothetical protein
LLLSPEKGIALTFPTDGRGRAVAGIKTQVVSQGKDLIDYGLNQFPMVTAGEIGPAYGTCKKGISCENRPRGLKTDPTGRMAGGMEDFNPVGPQRNLLSLGKGSIRPGPQARGIQGMNEDRCPGDAAEFAYTADMVHMAVGDQDIFYFQTAFGNLINKAQGFSSGIDYQPFSGLGMTQDIAVGLKGPDRDFF